MRAFGVLFTGSQVPLTVAALFYEFLKKEKHDALAYKRDGVFRQICTKRLQARVERLALAMRARGLKTGDRVAILSENRPEWAITDLACALLGFIDVAIYPTLTSAQVAHILQDSGARWVFCSNPEQLKKVMMAVDNLPHLELAVLMEGDIPARAERPILTFRNLREEGKELDGDRQALQQEALTRKPDDILTLIYTSGSTGDPKGAILTHGNVMSEVEMLLNHLAITPNGRYLSFLPLSHVFERVCGLYTMLALDNRIYYSEGIQSVAAELKTVRPTIFLAVPRFYEKIYEKVFNAVAEGSFVKHSLFHWARRTARRAVPQLYEGRNPAGSHGAKYTMAKLLVFNRLNKLMGGELEYAISGGAPLSPKVLDFFWSMGIRLIEGYGLTETTSACTGNRLGAVKPGCVGFPLLESWQGMPFVKIGPEDEILVKGPTVFKGYWNNEVANREAFDEEGYFRTGDIGKFDAQGRLIITDRKKELLITSGGKKIAPQPIENELRGRPYIEQAVVVGNKRNFITALIVPNFEPLERWAKLHQIQYTDRASFLTQNAIVSRIQREVDTVNAKLSPYEQIKKFYLLDKEITPESGLMTPTLKIKRTEVTEYFRDVIDSLYRES